MNLLYVFVHLPKTGGDTFSNFMEKFFSHNNTRNGFSYRYPRGVDPKDGWDKVRFVYGHFDINFIENDLNFRDREFVYFTFLRNPMERLYSNYYYANRGKVTIKQWLQSDDYFVENLMTKYLGNAGGKSATEKNLEIAMKNLTRSDVNFGITEHYDESLRRFQVKFPDIFPTIKYERKRISVKPDNYNNNSELNTMIWERNQLDLRLYKFALNLWR